MPQQFSFPSFDGNIASSGNSLFSGITITGSHTLDPGFTDVWAFGDFAPSSPIYITLNGSFDTLFPQHEWLITIGSALTIPTVTLTASSNLVVYDAPGQASLLYDFEITNNDNTAKPYSISISTTLTVEQALAIFAAHHSSAGLPIADSLANVVSNLDNLTLMVSDISTVALIDATTPTLSLSGSQYLADIPLIDKISSPLNLSITLNAGAHTVSAPHNAPISSKGGQNAIIGDGHHNAIAFADASTSHVITKGTNGLVTISGSSSPTDQLSNIEFLVFTDKIFFIENADSANIARLYSAALDRSPDMGGLSGWEEIYASNISSAAKAGGVYLALAQTSDGFGSTIAGGFAQSPEFLSKYGKLDDAAFVTQLYLNVLDRAPATAELNAWLGLMHNSGFTHDMVLVGFAESPENIAKTAADWLIQI